MFFEITSYFCFCQEVASCCSIPYNQIMVKLIFKQSSTIPVVKLRLSIRFFNRVWQVNNKFVWQYYEPKTLNCHLKHVRIFIRQWPVSKHQSASCIDEHSNSPEKFSRAVSIKPRTEGHNGKLTCLFIMKLVRQPVDKTHALVSCPRKASFQKLC